MEPHLIILLAVGGLLSLYVARRAVFERRQRLAVEAASAKPQSEWAIGAVFLALFWTGYWLVFAALGRWWPQAQLPFAWIWFGLCVLGFFVSLTVRSRRQRRS
jgi:hypothetical protein